MIQQSEHGELVAKDRAGQGEMRASDADRDTAAGLLSAAFAEGRLTAGEHAERVQAAYRARTERELGELTGDLPASAGNPVSRTAGWIPGEMHCWLVCALLILCPPAGIAWLLASWSRSRTLQLQVLGFGSAGAADR